MTSSNTYLPISPVVPNTLLISNITQSNQAVVTVTAANTYVIGQVIKLTVPASYGMYQADQLSGQILAISGLNFTTDINTFTFDAFVTPSTFQEQPASLAPSGSRNLYNNQTVPFHSVGNTGN